MPTYYENQTGGGTGGGVIFDGTIAIGDIAKRSGVNTIGKVTAIPAGLIVSAQAVATFTATFGGQSTILAGTNITQVDFAWTYNRNLANPTSQSIGVSSSNVTGAPNPGAQAVALRSSSSTGLTMGITAAPSPGVSTFSLTGIGDDGTPLSASAQIAIRNRRYYGVSQNTTLTQAQIRALSTEFITGLAVTHSFDCSVNGGNNFIYMAWPTSFGQPTLVTFPTGQMFTDYSISTVTNFDNGTGFLENYYLMRVAGASDTTYNAATGLNLAIVS